METFKEEFLKSLEKDHCFDLALYISRHWTKITKLPKKEIIEIKNGKKFPQEVLNLVNSLKYDLDYFTEEWNLVKYSGIG